MNADDFWALIEYLINRVKELKRDNRLMKKEIDDAFGKIKELADAKIEIIHRQNELKARLTKLENKIVK